MPDQIDGKPLRHHPSTTSYSEIRVSLSLGGGKGGFGSMLRAAGKLNKTTNKSAMRYLSGRQAHRWSTTPNWCAPRSWTRAGGTRQGGRRRNPS